MMRVKWMKKGYIGRSFEIYELVVYLIATSPFSNILLECIPYITVKTLHWMSSFVQLLKSK